MMQSENNLVWIDLEMTGLDSLRDRIIEMATIITTNDLDILAEGPVLVVHVDDSVLSGMDDWNTTQHARSGLIERVRKSRLSNGEAERLTLDFIKQYVPEGSSPMCGNSICQDRRFLARLMPELERYFHYRNLDVSTLKILVNRWAPGQQQFIKESTHLALQDVRDSIEELRFYRHRYLKI
ncbi:MAG TPA: oligoribonuclease [Gammaproteobacteria bacterium]|nr:oligoribonuclease [Gammaproteobacteria bacterium]